VRTIVQFDIDGVLVDFVRGFVLYGEKYGYLDRILDGWSDLTNSRYGTSHLVGEEANKEIWSAIQRDPCFWEELPAAAVPEAFRRINRLQHRGAIIYFATNRSGMRVKNQTVGWLADRGIENPTVVLTAQKGKIAAGLGATHSIEDKAGNAVYIGYESPATKSCLINRPYNAFDPAVLGSKVTRVATVEDFLDIVEADY